MNGMNTNAAWKSCFSEPEPVIPIGPQLHSGVGERIFRNFPLEIFAVGIVLFRFGEGLTTVLCQTNEKQNDGEE